MDLDIALHDQPHRRRNALTGEWVLVSPHRTKRPWQGQVETAAAPAALPYDPQCYLCPGNPRAGGERNPLYGSTFAFDNDFAALLPQTAPAGSTDALFTAAAERGICRVVCFSPRHDLTLARMSPEQIRPVVDRWVLEYDTLCANEWVRYVQIFENRGDMMGASNPHPHGQIWASESLPNEPAKELAAQRSYLDQTGRCLLCDYAAREIALGTRLVSANSDFAALVPFWALWPFELLLVARRHLPGFSQLHSGERDSLAAILSDVTRRYDALFRCPFPYTMGFHPAPAGGGPHPEWHFHAHFYPPLLRSATVRKFMVGYEMLATPQRDITPEQAAARLRDTLQAP